MMLCDFQRKRTVLEKLFTPKELHNFSRCNDMDQEPIQVAVEKPGNKSEKQLYPEITPTPQLLSMEMDIKRLQEQQAQFESRLAGVERYTCKKVPDTSRQNKHMFTNVDRMNVGNLEVFKEQVVPEWIEQKLEDLETSFQK